MRTTPTARTAWTGTLVLGLRNGRGWSVGDAEVNVRRDCVIVEHAGRSVATLDRGRFRDWLMKPEPAPLAEDDAIWSVQAGLTFLAVMSGSQAAYRVTTESLAELVAVI